MGGTAVVVGVGLGVALALLAALAVSASLVGQLDIGRSVVVSAVRGILQLAAVALVIVTVVRSVWLTALFVVLMFAVAARTSSSRINGKGSGWASAAAIAAGTAPTLAVVLLSGAVPPTGIAVVPVAGIVIGGAMSATSLAGRRALDDLAGRHDEFEAMMALGGTPAGRRHVRLSTGRDAGHGPGARPDPHGRPRDTARRLRRRAPRQR